MLNMDFGVAVSYFDLAHVYAAEGKIDSALVFAYANLEYWSTRNDTGRIGGAHCLLAYLYSLDGNYKEAKKFIAQNEMLLLTSDVHWQLKLDQLYLGTIVYSESDESDLAHKYKDQYDRLVEELKTKHIKARTQY